MRHTITLLCAVSLLLPSWVAQAQPKLPPGTPKGYLPVENLPDSLALLPAPPPSGSAGFRRDEEARAGARAFKGTARWARAVSDADLHFPHAAQTFSCAADLEISKERTPHLYTLLGRSFIDVGLSTYRAKNHYNRVRPFVLHRQSSCTPAEEKMLRGDGSYPSGHSAAGWGWALLLTELVPERADAILLRGRDFGESRIVCNVHWRSDVDAGRVIAAATIARLHAEPAFKADFEAAKGEIAAERAGHAKPAAQACAAEAASLRAEPK
jgi:acid phosphatase (class A)